MAAGTNQVNNQIEDKQGRLCSERGARMLCAFLVQLTRRGFLPAVSCATEVKTLSLEAFIMVKACLPLSEGTSGMSRKVCTFRTIWAGKP